MQSPALVRRGGQWRICALHASPLLLSRETIEAYPLTFAQPLLAQVKAELRQEAFEMINQGLSGGILGAYAWEPYPFISRTTYLLG